MNGWPLVRAPGARSARSSARSVPRTRQHGRLRVTWPAALDNPPIASDEQRLQALTVLLADRRADPRVRFGAAAVLLFAQPLSRVAALRRGDLTQAAGGWLIRFGPRRVHATAALDELLEDANGGQCIRSPIQKR